MHQRVNTFLTLIFFYFISNRNIFYGIKSIVNKFSDLTLNCASKVPQASNLVSSLCFYINDIDAVIIIITLQLIKIVLIVVTALS